MKMRLTRRYAQALFRLALRWQVLHEVEEELTLVEQVFTEEEVCSFFENPSVSTADKKATIMRLFGSNISSLVQNFLCHITDKRRTEILLAVVKAYRTLVKQASNILEVQIVTATPLAEQDREQLVIQLADMTGKEIELQSRIDPRILGGLIIQVGDKRIDNSVMAKLAKLKNHMMSKSF
jgi:F-type H+-transporting ATPase subunit delta